MICLHKEDKKDNCPHDSQTHDCTLRICVTCRETTQECKEYEITPPYASDLSDQDLNIIYDTLEEIVQQYELTILQDVWVESKFEEVKTQGRDKAIEYGYLDEDRKMSQKYIEQHGVQK